MVCKRSAFKRGISVVVLTVVMLGVLGFSSVWAAGGADEGTPGSVAGTAIDPTDGSPVSDAVVTIGAEKITTGADGEFRFENLSAGTAELTIIADGFAEATWEVEISTEDACQLGCVGLLPARYVGRTCIIVDSRPCQAFVALDGRLLTRQVDGEDVAATTPVLIYNIASGTHNLAVSKKDYKTAKVMAKVEDGTLCRVAVKLKKKDRKFIGWWPLLGAGAVAIASSSGSDRAVSTYQISGTVRRTDGTPVPNTDIRVVQGETIVTTGTTDATGYYRVYLPEDSPGTYTVQARYGDTFQDEKTVILTPEARKGNADFEIPMYSISGTITEAGTGNPVAGVTVHIGDSLVTTAANGGFTLGGLQEGQYLVRPEMSEWSFQPGQQNVTITAETGDVDGVDFTGTPNSYSISGRVTLSDSSGVAGLVVTAAPVLLAPAAVNAANGGYSATTQADGSYTITGLPPATYQVNPTGYEMTFDPQSREATVNENVGNATDVNFTAIPNRYSISGRVTDSSGAPMSDVPVTAQLTVKASGVVTAQTYEAATETDGTYVIGDLPPDTYKVTPQPLEGWNFVPPNQTVTVNEANGNATDVDFVGYPPATTFSISGMVTIEGEGPGLEGVTIVAQLQGESDAVSADEYLPPHAITNAEGAYIITGLVSGTYIVRPLALAGWTFDPEQREETVNRYDGDATNVDFCACPDTYSISGRVTDDQENGLEGVPVSAVLQVTGEAVRTTQRPVVHTGDEGQYEFTGLGAGTYTVEPTKVEWTFAPPRRDVNLDPTNGSATDVNFIGTPNTYLISGRITLESAEGIQGVLVIAEPVEATAASAVVPAVAAPYSAHTAADGAYTIDGLPPDSYKVTPYMEEWAFEPETRDVTVNVTEGNAENVDFLGTPPTQTYSISGIVWDEQSAGIGGVTLTATPLVEAESNIAQAGEDRTAVTAEDGTYAITGLPAADYIVIPQAIGWRFEPEQREVTVGPDVGGNATDVDFTGIQESFSICGTVVQDDEGATPIEGVQVVATQGELALLAAPAVAVLPTATTDQNGHYCITGLPGGDYIVTPMMTAYVFDPVQRNVTVDSWVGNAENVDFVGSGEVSGDTEAVLDINANAFVTALACLPTRAGGAQITFALSADAAVTADVMNIAGRPIRMVVSDKPMTAGTATLLWDGKSGRGLNVPSGIYLIRLRVQDEAGGQSEALSTVQMMR